MKKFHAKDMAEAMKMMKAELGANAVILHTRDTGKGLLGWLTGGGVEVTAAVDARPAAPPPKPAPPPKELRASPVKPPVGGSVDFKVSDEPTNGGVSSKEKEDNPLLALSKKIDKEKKKNALVPPPGLAPSASKKVEGNPLAANPDLEKRLANLENRLIKLTGLIEHLSPSLATGEVPSVPSRTRDVYNHLLEQDVDESLALSIAAQVAETSDESDDVWTVLRSRLISMIPVEPALELDFNAKRPKIVMLAGPTGVGKTTSLAKISAQYRYTKNSGVRPKIVFITADLYRLAAVEQLQKYSEILGAELEVTYSPEEVRQALNKHKDAHLVLFDTAGTCQRNMPQMSTLSAIAEACNPTEIHLVLSATTKYSDIIDIVEHFKEVKPTRLLFTKIDESTTFGTILNAVRKFNIPLSYLTTGQNVPEDIECARTERVAKLLLTKPAIDRSIESKKIDPQPAPAPTSEKMKEKTNQDKSDEAKNC
ncbi:MAG: flagellar biosynthesis protein FlhF [Candidatus Omnitrophota bacterium]